METNFTLLGILGPIGTGELIAIALIVLLLFGGKKIPELMRGLGKGVRNFKDGMKDMEEQIKKPADENNEHKKVEE
jgi:sec-independent protein translocase protein TatA